MKGTELERRARRIAWPEPSPGLRGHVLKTTAPMLAHRITWSDRIWFSRAWRVTALAILAAAIALEALQNGFRVTGESRADPLTEAHLLDDTLRDLGLPGDLAASLARRGTTGDAGTGAAGQRLRLAVQALETEGVRQ
jgi:hypothetical protein